MPSAQAPPDGVRRTSNRMPAKTGTSHPSPSQVFRTPYNLRSARAKYLAEAVRHGAYLHNPTADFDALLTTQAPQGLGNRKSPRSGFNWGDDGQQAELSSSWREVQVKPLVVGQKRQEPPQGAQTSSKRQKTEPAPNSNRPKRPRGGRLLKKHGGDEQLARKERLHERSYLQGAVYQNAAFSMVEHTSPTSTGWHGLPPPAWAEETIRRKWREGQIQDVVQTFFPVPYVDEGMAANRPTILQDQEGHTFFYRTSPADWLGRQREDLEKAIERLLRPTLDSEAAAKKHRDNGRGPHLPCIIGHFRQYQKAPKLTLWHRENQARVEAFLEEEVVKSITRWVTSVVELMFPGVAGRYRKCADWHEKTYGFRPLFGLFFNLCINACFPGQRRVHCAPHVDAKNIVGVCVLVIYQLGETKFNHKRRSWLVLWEAGVAIELPPWVLAAYPSSLLFHFNIDLTDFEFVTAPEGEQPTRQNSEPLVEGDEQGRGSLVYFNEATMYQSSETNCATLTEAKNKGHSGVVDYGESVQEAFEKFGTLWLIYYTLPSIQKDLSLSVAWHFSCCCAHRTDALTSSHQPFAASTFHGGIIPRYRRAYWRPWKRMVQLLCDFGGGMNLVKLRPDPEGDRVVQRILDHDDTVIPILGEKYSEYTSAPTEALLDHYIGEAEALMQSEGEEKEGAVEEQPETTKVPEEILGSMRGKVPEDQEEEIMKRLHEFQEQAPEELGELFETVQKMDNMT
ncbi:uncharacterized protein LACBIDRAFT_332267 [Laccaria bicolor S238N-H82]|uniref:Predicted protein n=1 Tax=Laccaria bicolor (strain S238N-H82 / ATCC MYA-4686) TaxID=486041 RepID=B0DS57_LACBS|nr:uncharacterized protein LACBIDRAFT_332267 [Laccaria bicolor S238N-H82]EDR02732.1 predicted protein [Laccaria bicolor S238N-H82]|eukprot:XP_001886776.1 predicted protein [Laccaria bicolor S238N-H82]